VCSSARIGSRYAARHVSSRLNVHLALLAVQVAFASLSIVGKRVLEELPPFALVAIRTPSAAIALWLIAFARRKWRIPMRDVAMLAALAVLGIAGNQLLFIAGLARTTATTAVVLGTTIPVFTVGIAIAAGRERATVMRGLGVALAFGGAIVTIGGGAMAGGEHLTGDLLIVANSFSYAAYLVLSRPVVVRHDPLVVITWVMTFGALMVLPFGASDAVTHAPAMSTGGWIAIAWIVGAATVGTYALNAWALRHAPASLVATYIYVQPPLAAVMAAIYLGERPGVGTLAGALMICAGIWTVSRAAR
jgi:drug/metabolite transporter (DMT)-like permease